MLNGYGFCPVFCDTGFAVIMTHVYFQTCVMIAASQMHWRH